MAAAVEKKMELTVDQKEVNVPVEGGSVYVTVTSTFDCRTAYKVKTSNMELFRTKPVYGFLEPKAHFKLEVLRLRPDKLNDTEVRKVQKLVIQWAEVTPEETDPAASFRAGAESGDVTILMKPTQRLVQAEVFR